LNSVRHPETVASNNPFYTESNVATAAAGEISGADGDRGKIAKLFDDTRKRLVETGTRNRLIHVNRANTKGNVLNIVNERADDVHSLLVEHKAMRFLAIGQDRDAEVQDLRLADAGEEGFAEDRYVDARLETRLGPDALAKKLLKIAREAKTAEEEQGVNILYLALGFLTWFEDKSSSIPREAPLVLLPVELVRNQRTSTYDLRIRDEDLLTNLPLQQRLRDDFGIDLPDIDVTDGWKPSAYFDQVQRVIATRPGWKIEADAIQLGFFSFSKLLMYLDLAVEAWPEGALGTHALTRGLLYEGFEHEAPLFGPSDRLDTVLPPEKIFHVVDADASQARVIEEVRSGRNLVVQGPPGTGKSQTITNIIAAAAREGKRVLFVAEKMAALSVVHDRLVKVGLRDICLELHSRSANKKVVLAELARTIVAAQSAPAAPAAPVALKAARDQLNDIAEALHEPIGASGETPFSVLSRQARYIGLGAAPPSLAGERLAEMGRQEEEAVSAILAEYADLIGGEGAAHPFEGTRNLDLQPVDLNRLAPLLKDAATGARRLAEALRAAIREIGCDLPIDAGAAERVSDSIGRLRDMPPEAGPIAPLILAAPDHDRLAQALEAGRIWREAYDAASGIFTDAALQAPPPAGRAALLAGATSFLARWGGAYRGASRELAALLRKPLPGTADERVALLDQLVELAALRSAWANDGDYCARILGDHWRGERTDFARIEAIAGWCSRVRGADIAAPHSTLIGLGARQDDVARLLRSLADAGSEFGKAADAAIRMLDLDQAKLPGGSIRAGDLEELGARFELLAGSGERYATWGRLQRLRRRLEEQGLGTLIERLNKGDLDADQAVTELRFARAEALWRAARDQHPVLREISATNRHDIVASFAALERQRLKENVAGVLAGHLAQVPQGAQGEMGVIRGEIGKKSRHMAIRRLFGKAGTAIQRIKPVLLMSPISVAQFLPPGALSFDLLVIDEASQVRPEDALGAIARAGQIVVVGDQKQLPPSSFFDRLLADEDGDEETGESEDLLAGAAKVADMESILTLCEARGLGTRMLKWHYRSRDPSLIEVSNREFYDNDLVLPPSPLQADPAYGLCFTRVDGVYDKGGKRDNRKEGEAIVARIAEHARAHPTLSLGVVTFSFAQRNLITELLELARRTDATLDTFLREGQSEDPFVKNIENVQGDERDVILVSVGYGPTIPGGRLASMSFGPVNGEGGERRLNVLFTRARVRCEVFASFDPGDIDPARARGEGTRILKRFLDFAKSGRIDDRSPTGAAADTPFEEDVGDVIRSLGFLADPQVGSAGFRIDIGVRHPERPGTYLLAVECDGAAYHSALWARERDRLRQDVLEHLGWRLHRIWSTDWFYNRAAEIQRLKAALAEARERAEAGIRIEGANKAQPAVERNSEGEPAAFGIPEVALRQMPLYRRFVFPVTSQQEPHEVPAATLAELAGRIVQAEGPIHQDEVARRIAASFGKEKAGSRIMAATLAALGTAQRKDGDLRSDGAFWFTRAQAEAPPVRDRSAESGATIKAASISALEIRAALALARDDNAGGDGPELIRTAARLMGFRRVGPDLQARMAEGLEALG
jgi:hypothetical protein